MSMVLAAPRRLARRVGDAAFLIRAHRARLGRWPNPLWRHGFNEHILHRLILRRDPLHALLSDKIAMRRFAAGRMPEVPLVPLLAVLEPEEPIPWDSLPRALVLKPNASSAAVHAIADSATADRAAIEADVRGWMITSYYAMSREWGYRDIPNRLLVEALLPSLPGETSPRIHQLYCFGGRMALAVIRRHAADGSVTNDCFGPDWQPLPLRYNLRARAGIPPPPADAQARMARLAARLAGGIDHLRVDFYVVDGAPILGELTVFANAGRGPFDPPAWDLWLGAVWRATRRGAPWPPRPG